MFPHIMISVRLIALIGFIIANYICYLFFQSYITNIQHFYYIALVFLSFMILKLDFTLLFYENIKSKLSFKKRNITNKKAKKHINLFSIAKTLIKSVFNVKNELVFLKNTFFNTLYELFSVYIVWISAIGFVHLTNLHKIELIDYSSFFQISALFGLLLGIFQFLLQRHEDKILTKVNYNSKRMEQIINQECSFDKFYNSIPQTESTKTLRNWIHKTTDPKLQTIDFFISLLEEGETRKFLLKYIKKIPISINISYQQSNQKFETLDIKSIIDTTRRKDLHEAYRRYFTSDDRINEVIEKISQEINLDDFRLLALSNINIVSELLPQFTNNNFVKVIDELLSEEQEVDKNIKFESSKEYQQYLHNQVIIRITKKIL